MNNFYFHSINQLFLLNSRNAVCILAVLMTSQFKISHQTLHHQLATKFASVLQDTCDLMSATDDVFSISTNCLTFSCFL